LSGVHSFYGKPISELRSVTCHMGLTQCYRYLSPDTGEHGSSYNLDWLVLDLLTPKGWKAELTSI